MQALETKSGFINTIAKLYRQEGVMRFYRGAIPVVLGCLPSHTAFFATYELVKQKLRVDNQVIYRIMLEISLLGRFHYWSFSIYRS